jgi:hypothetical protein
MKTKKHAFVPSPLSRLEDRVVLSSGAHFTAAGAAILTGHALGRAASGIQSAFVQFSNHGQSHSRLNSDLAKAASLIPYNRRDGLLSGLLDEVRTMADDINTRQTTPVKSAFRRAEASLHEFVQQEVASGRVVIR